MAIGESNESNPKAEKNGKLATDLYLKSSKSEPVEVGDHLEVKIERILPTKRGEAIIKDKNGRPYLIFVTGKSLKVGDTVKVSITELMGGFANAIAHSGNW